MKRTPLKRDPEQVRNWQLRSQKAAQQRIPKARKAVKRIKPKRAVQQREYSVLRLEFLAEHPFCKPCHDGGATTPATEIHHMAGREGERLCDDSKFLETCRNCHDWIEANPVEAMLKGYCVSRHRTTQPKK